MKNIHVLSTDKPSRLTKNNLGQFIKLTGLQHQEVNINQNIYITSDEEIKEGDWFYLDMSHSNTLPDEIHQMGNDKWSKTGGIHFCEGNSWVDSCKKIILTTDQDLIKNGIQAIDDDFLEWFVKNPNCESVELNGRLTVKENGIQELMKDEYYQKFTEELPNCVFINHYKIIIPKEESLSYEDFRKKASKELLEKFDNEASKRSGDGDFDNYFYGNCRYWENKLKEEPTELAKIYNTKDTGKEEVAKSTIGFNK